MQMHICFSKLSASVQQACICCSTGFHSQWVMLLPRAPSMRFSDCSAAMLMLFLTLIARSHWPPQDHPHRCTALHPDSREAPLARSTRASAEHRPCMPALLFDCLWAGLQDSIVSLTTLRVPVPYLTPSDSSDRSFELARQLDSTAGPRRGLLPAGALAKSTQASETRICRLWAQAPLQGLAGCLLLGLSQAPTRMLRQSCACLSVTRPTASPTKAMSCGYRLHAGPLGAAAVAVQEA